MKSVSAGVLEVADLEEKAIKQELIKEKEEKLEAEEKVDEQQSQMNKINLTM